MEGVKPLDPCLLLDPPAAGVGAELDAADGEVADAAGSREVSRNRGVGPVGDAAEVLRKTGVEAARGLSNVTGATIKTGNQVNEGARMAGDSLQNGKGIGRTRITNRKKLTAERANHARILAAGEKTSLPVFPLVSER